MHIWSRERDVCLRCGRTAREIIDLELKCWKEQGECLT